ncbi:MAG: alpha/beta hydrolase [Bacteroidetes bacterium]|nr:MAG: alpha/beta hydrolase [Bacteroidota bacterium]
MLNSSKIFIKQFGSGRPIVWIHGFLESGTMWEHLALDRIPGKHLCIDLPGHGKSPDPEVQFSIRELAVEIQLLLAGMGYEEYDLVGHSLGGYVALEMHRIMSVKGKLVLFHSNFWADGPQKKKDRTRVADLVMKDAAGFVKQAIPLLFIDRKRDAKQIEELIREALQMNTKSIAQYSRAMRDRRSNIRYALSISDQLLVIQGEEDPVIPLEQMLHYDEKLQIESFSETGHMGHIERSQEISQRLNLFLR